MLGLNPQYSSQRYFPYTSRPYTVHVNGQLVLDLEGEIINSDAIHSEAIAINSELSDTIVDSELNETDQSIVPSDL